MLGLWLSPPGGSIAQILTPPRNATLAAPRVRTCSQESAAGTAERRAVVHRLAPGRANAIVTQNRGWIGVASGPFSGQNSRETTTSKLLLRRAENGCPADPIVDDSRPQYRSASERAGWTHGNRGTASAPRGWKQRGLPRGASDGLTPLSRVPSGTLAAESAVALSGRRQKHR